MDTKDLKSLPYGSAGSSPAEATNLVIFSCFLLHSLAAGDKFSKKTFSMCAINSNKSLMSLIREIFL